jgi:hypothetical protein
MGVNEKKLHARIVGAFASGRNRDRTFARGVIRQTGKELDEFAVKGIVEVVRSDGISWQATAEEVLDTLENPPSNNAFRAAEIALMGLLDLLCICRWDQWTRDAQDKFEEKHEPLTDNDDTNENEGDESNG